MIPNIPEWIYEGRQPTIAPSKTYKLDIKNKRIVGQTDGLDAVRQAVFLHLSCERYETPIFNENYGVEFDQLKGKSMRYAELVIESRIKDALSIDTRILDLKDFVIVPYDKRTLYVSFSVISTEGEYGEEFLLSV